MSYVVCMPTAVLSDDAREVSLIGIEKPEEDYATWKEFVVLRDRRVVHCYNLVSHGRRIYRTLIFSSESKFALHSMQPNNIRPSCRPTPPAVRHSSGSLGTFRMADPSLVIARTNVEIGGERHGGETWGGDMGGRWREIGRWGGKRRDNKGGE
jgi:hypothetical protein